MLAGASVGLLARCRGNALRQRLPQMVAMSTELIVGSTVRYDGALRWASEAVLGGFYRVYNELGSGFLESVYEAAMAMVLGSTGLHVQRQAPVSVRFRGR